MKLVKQAAKIAMPNTKVVDENGYPMIVYHGSDKNFNVFNRGFFDSSKFVAQTYSYDNILYSSFLNITKPAIIKNNKNINIESWYHIWMTKEEAKKYGISDSHDYDEIMPEIIKDYNNVTGKEWVVTVIDDIVDAVKSNKKYDGVILVGVYGDTNLSEKYEDSHNEYIPISPEQVKSAEPFTFDGEGNLIPLSKKFDLNNKDMRFE